MTPSRAALRTILIGSTVVASALVAVPASHALTVAPRFASQTGTGTACTQAAPCSVVQAVNHATDGADVTIEPGAYGSPSSPLTQTLAPPVAGITVHGQAGKPMPVVYSNASVGYELDDQGSVSDLEMVVTNGIAFFTFSTASHVIGVTTSADGTACSFAASFTDSLCLAEGADSSAVRVSIDDSPSPVTDTYAMRGVTAVATGTNSYGLAVYGGADNTVNFNAVNSIVKGAGHDILAQGTKSTTHINVSLDHSDYATTQPVSVGAGTSVVTGDAADVHAAPKFVDAAHGNYEEAKGSPTINAGIADPPGVDLATNPRTLGSSPDIGAYEFEQPPVTKHLTLVKAHRHSLKFDVKVNNEGLPATLKVHYSTGSHHAAKSVPLSTHDDSDVSKAVFTLHGLKPHAKYRVKAVASNAGGHAHPATATASTK